VTGKTVVFLCVANSARSQMAEGLARARAPRGWRVFSAGSNPARLSSTAVEAMSEVGIDISSQYSKGVQDVPLDQADFIITLCADEVCPVVPGGRAKRLHWPLPDPAGVTGDPAARLERFRAVRVELAGRIEGLWVDGRTDG
jgi:arsenate reductase